MLSFAACTAVVACVHLYLVYIRVFGDIEYAVMRNCLSKCAVAYACVCAQCSLVSSRESCSIKITLE